jgi:hypothetical protein
MTNNVDENGGAMCSTCGHFIKECPCPWKDGMMSVIPDDGLDAVKCLVCLNHKLECVCAPPEPARGPPPYEYRDDCTCSACTKVRQEMKAEKIHELSRGIQVELDKFEQAMNRHDNTGGHALGPPASFPALPIDIDADKLVDDLLASARVKAK